MLSIDRFENGYAVCVNDDGKIYNIKCELIENGADAGDIIEQKNGIYVVLKDETEKRREEIQRLQDELFE